MQDTMRWSRRAVLGVGGLVIFSRGAALPVAGRAMVLPKVRFEARVIGADDAPRGAVVAAVGAGDTIVGSLTTEVGVSAFASRGNSLDRLPVDGSTSAARAINRRDAIAGSADGKAVVWRGDVVTGLETLGGETGEAFGINDDGLAVGQAATEDGRTHAVLWQRGGTARDLSADDISLSIAYGINADGIVVGVTAVGGTGRAEHAARWVDGELVDLGTLGGDVSQATAINAAGVTVGSSSIAPGFGSVDHAVSWSGESPAKPAVPTDLGVLGTTKVPGRESELAFDQSQARAINAEGWIVGYGSSSAENAPHSLATIWLDGRITDLNALIGDAAQDLVLTRASGVNDAGRIVCTGFERGADERIDRVVLLTPR